MLNYLGESMKEQNIRVLNRPIDQSVQVQKKLH